jgi:mitochondrial fission protein ELM1
MTDTRKGRAVQEPADGSAIHAPDAVTGPGGPRVWVLLDDRPGNTTQAVGLAEALGWPFERKPLSFNALANLPNWLLGATRRTLERSGSAGLEPPWPGVVISAGRRTAPVARWIGQRSHGETRLVQLGRKGGIAADAFDVVITPLHTRMLPHPRRIETLGPLNPITSQRLKAAVSRWPHLVEGLPRPLVVLLVGGSTPRYTLGAQLAGRMGAEVAAFARAQGGSVLVVTSRRTGAEASRALSDAVGPQGEVHLWRAGGDSPYPAYLAYADVLVVTGESESMLAEVAAVGKPMFIYPIPQKPPTVKTRLKEWMLAKALAHAPGAEPFAGRPRIGIGALCATLIHRGIVMPPRRIEVLHQALIDRGIARYFGQALPQTPMAPLQETADVARRVKDLLGPSHAARTPAR